MRDIKYYDCPEFTDEELIEAMEAHCEFPIIFGGAVVCPTAKSALEEMREAILYARQDNPRLNLSRYDKMTADEFVSTLYGSLTMTNIHNFEMYLENLRLYRGSKKFRSEVLEKARAMEEPMEFIDLITSMKEYGKMYRWGDEYLPLCMLTSAANATPDTLIGKRLREFCMEYPELSFARADYFEKDMNFCDIFSKKPIVYKD